MRAQHGVALAVLCIARAAQARTGEALVAETRQVLEKRVGRPPLESPVFVGAGDSGECFTRMLENWLCHFRRLAIREYVFFALDTEAVAFMKAMDEPVVDLTQPAAGSIGAYGSASYFSATRTKVTAASVVLNLGYSIILLDIDVALMHDPRPFLLERAARLGADMQFQLNYPSRDVNTGVYHARPTPATLQIMRMWLAEAQVGTVDDQGILFAMLKRECKGRENVFFAKKAKVQVTDFIRIKRCGNLSVHIATLPVLLFRTGYRGLRLRGDVQGETVCWHANFMVGSQKKHEFLLHRLPAMRIPSWCAANTTLCSATKALPASAIPPARSIKLVAFLAFAAVANAVILCICARACAR